jgi:HupE / UreJ protein
VPATPATRSTDGPSSRQVRARQDACALLVVALAAVVLAGSAVLEAHGVSGTDALFLQGITGPAIGPLMYLGAKHMVTGYDHLAFLVGVIFFLYRTQDVVKYVSLFTLGHSLTLLLGVLGGVRANPYVIDAIIGFSVVYKALDNMDAFRQFFGFQPDPRAAVLVFGLFHGFGLATKLQEFSLSPNGLVINILSFNVGVEIGQVVALTMVLACLAWWRTRRAFLQHAFLTNGALMACGLLLMAYQMSAYVLAG